MKEVKIEFTEETMELPDDRLTQVDPDTAFVIGKDKKIKFIFRKRKEEKMLQRLFDLGINIKDIRRNKYGDLLILK